MSSEGFDTAQVYYNLLNPSASFKNRNNWNDHDFSGLIDDCLKYDIGIICIRIFAAGILATDIRHGREIPITVGISEVEQERRVKKIINLTKDQIGTRAQIALRYGLSNKSISCIVVGFEKLDHLNEIIEAKNEGPLEEDFIEEINKRKLNCVAVDIPSGVDSNTGEVLGVAPRCDLTVTFFRKKPGHLLNPGRDLSGEISIADIGIDTAFLKTVKTTIFENSPKHWLKELPHPVSDDHKFKRGSTLIVGGPSMTGASRLAAKSAARIGSGLVTITAPSEALALYASDDPSFIIKPYKNCNEIFDLFEDERFTSILIGPGCGVNQTTKDLVQKALSQEKPVVLDADALTVFKDYRADLNW